MKEFEEFSTPFGPDGEIPEVELDQKTTPRGVVSDLGFPDVVTTCEIFGGGGNHLNGWLVVATDGMGDFISLEVGGWKGLDETPDGSIEHLNVKTPDLE